MTLFHLVASPVHIVGDAHPQMAQPSKALHLFPRPSEASDSGGNLEMQGGTAPPPGKACGMNGVEEAAS